MRHTAVPTPAAAIAVGFALLLAASPVRADHGDCGQPVSPGRHPAASDALATLRVAVGTATCGDGPWCMCDVDGSGRVTASDALTVLSSAVGRSVALDCSNCLATTSSSSTTTSTAVTMTTLVPGVWEPGRLLYDDRCASCHRLAGYDATGYASDLDGRGNRLRRDLGTISGAMNGMTLSTMELEDLGWFLDGLVPEEVGPTTTLDPGVSSTTSTTTTTLPTVPEAAGRAIYDARCASCHAAGSHDPGGYAGDLAGEGDDLRADLGRLDREMNGILLAASEIANLRAFLDGLSPSGSSDEDDEEEEDEEDDDREGGNDD